MNKQRLGGLFKKYVDKTISSEERDELMQYINAAPSEEMTPIMEEVFHAQMNNKPENFFAGEQGDKMLKGILAHIDEENMPKRSKYNVRRYLLRLSAVAAILILGLTFVALFYKYYSDSIDPVSVQDYVAVNIPPGGDQATLTLADGSVISLGGEDGGKIAEQGNVIITKTDEGQLVYKLKTLSEELSLADNGIPIYNTITTPRGGQYQVVLPDGTKVWLNAESSLRYPTLFSKTERRVELQGEGYFEVAKNEKAPFIVKTDEQFVKVLGTHFNINSYKKHRRTETTLLEGSVEVSSSAGYSGRTVSRILKPGEQAVVRPKRGIEVSAVQATNAIAWKQGLFYFDDTAIQDVMEELSRWYNFDFEFEGKVPTINLWGKIYRNVNAAEALDILSYFNMKYRIVENPTVGPKWKIIVSPM